jgi:hypothetical protein
MTCHQIYHRDLTPSGGLQLPMHINPERRFAVPNCHPERRSEPRLRGEDKRGTWVVRHMEATLRRQKPRSLDNLGSRAARAKDCSG